MKLTAILVVVALAGVKAEAKSDFTLDSGRQITVYVRDNGNVSFAAEAMAQGLASKMFGEIGVTVHWRTGSPAATDTGSIAIEFTTNTPATLKPGALAYALPYEGVHIRIFWDRLQAGPFPREILAHVMVHEITHILQGVPRHSDEGIMKAHWTHEDHLAMKSQPLTFTPRDVELIYEGLDARASHAPKPAGLATIAASSAAE
jgi:hypothetical protein